MPEQPTGMPPEEIGMGSFSRHAKSHRHQETTDPASTEYPSLTVHGVEQARETARTDLLEIIRKAPERSILFLGGKSDQDRTSQTGEVYGDELKKFEQTDDIVVITKKEIEMLAQPIAEGSPENLAEGFVPGEILRALEKIRQIIKEHPEQKIVITYPLEIKQLTYAHQGRWTEAGEKTEYFDKLVGKYHGSHAEAVHDWLKNKGVLTLADGKIIQGPRPEDVAKQYLKGLERLYKFAQRASLDRPTAVHAVGHQWDLDAVATYLAKGRVTYEDFLEVMGRPEEDPEKMVIGESEVISNITIDPKTQRTTVRYRGREFSTKL